MSVEGPLNPGHNPSFLNQAPGAQRRSQRLKDKERKKLEEELAMRMKKYGVSVADVIGDAREGVESYAKRISHAALYDQNSMYYMMLFDDIVFLIRFFAAVSGLKILFFEGPEWDNRRAQDEHILEQIALLTPKLKDSKAAQAEKDSLEEQISDLESLQKQNREQLLKLRGKKDGLGTINEEPDSGSNIHSLRDLKPSSAKQRKDDLANTDLQIETLESNFEARKMEIQGLQAKLHQQDNAGQSIVSRAAIQEEIENLKKQLTTFDVNRDKLENYTIYRTKPGSLDLDFDNQVTDNKEVTAELLFLNGLHPNPSWEVSVRAEYIKHMVSMIGESGDPLAQVFAHVKSANKPTQPENGVKESENVADIMRSRQAPKPTP